MRFVSRSVITGFVNALAILIFMAQLPELTNVSWHVYAMTAAGRGIIYLFPTITKAVPSPLVAIVVLTAVALGVGIDIRTVGDMGLLPDSLPIFLLPEVPLNLQTLGIILPVSATLAVVGLLESMMTASIVDDLTDSSSNKNRECVGQGIANIASGFLGGMAGCAMIGQSVINVKSGGRGRLSTLTAGVLLLLMVVFFASAERFINSFDYKEVIENVRILPGRLGSCRRTVVSSTPSTLPETTRDFINLTSTLTRPAMLTGIPNCVLRGISIPARAKISSPRYRGR